MSDSIVFKRGKRYCGRTKKHVKITNNMGSLLHYILSSLTHTSEGFKLEFDDATREILKEFNYYDLVDTYERLGLNKGLFGDYLVNKSQKYVTVKVYKLYHTKLNKKQVSKNE